MTGAPIRRRAAAECAILAELAAQREDALQRVNGLTPIELPVGP
jgi:hypothetical protein